MNTTVKKRKSSVPSTKASKTGRRRVREAEIGRVHDAQWPLPMGPSFTVARTQLIQEMVRSVRRSGVVVLCAPSGFGKTALLLQFADEVRRDPGRGTVRVVDAREAMLDELIVQLDTIERECAQVPHPVIAIDDLPAFEGDAAKEFVAHVRGMREQGVEFAIACTPLAGETVRLLSDSAKLTAKQLAVRPREFAEWSRVLAISSKLDVYKLTQGVPALVAALQATVDTMGEERQPLATATCNLYSSVLDELERADDAIRILAETLLLVGSGSLRDFAAAGTPVDMSCLQRLVHDYPVFGYDAATNSFACMGADEGVLQPIGKRIAKGMPQIVRRAVRIQVRAGRAGRAVELLDRFLSPADALHVLSHDPMRFVLSGQAPFINRIIGGSKGLEEQTNADPNLELAVYGAALISGDMRLARTLAGTFAIQAEGLASHVDRHDWEVARALGSLWSSCRGVGLPEVSGFPPLSPGSCQDAEALALHERCFRGLIEQGTWTGEVERFLERRVGKPFPLASDSVACGIDIPNLLLTCDALLAEALTGVLGRIDERDSALAALVEPLREQRLLPILNHVRLVCSVRRLLSGTPLVDEQAVVDANTLAVRTSDLSLQLFSTIIEGWQDLTVNQAGSARFRGQQAARLADARHPFLARGAFFLERVASLRSISQLAIREEAGAIDLNRRDVDAEDAWACALYLSAAHCDAELTAWCSLQKDTLFTPSFRLFARLALSAMGEKADALRRMLPRPMLPYYILDVGVVPAPLFDEPDRAAKQEEAVGHITFRMLGGFSIERNGHIITSNIWKRKKTGMLAARLALAQGGLVDRQVLYDEFWPEMDYKHARENLYATVSMLRHSLGENGKDGPQYIVLQGGSIGVNPEFISSDVQFFEKLARIVLLGHVQLSAPKTIELCLRIEQLYTGPLFVPTDGVTTYFQRMKHVLQSKFIDCMVRGIDVALAEEDLTSALWMAEAGLQQDATREDLMRSAMHVYDELGRRKDIVELYGARMQSLEMQGKGGPEPETKRLYREIIERYRLRSIM